MKLSIEIDLLNDKAEDAVFALIWLANFVAQYPKTGIRRAGVEEYDNYRIKWRFVNDDPRTNQSTL